MKRHGDKILAVAICVAAVALDQLSKFAVRGMMDAHDGGEIVLIRGALSIVNSFNQGVAFGMFQGIRAWLIFLPIAAAVFILFFYLKEETKGRMWSAAGLGMMLGGAFGNQIDRFRLGGVYDFIEMYYRSYHWPTYNVADIFIVAGFALFALTMFGNPKPEEKKK